MTDSLNNDKIELDGLDKKLASSLSRDGQLSAGQAADILGVTAPTVRSRLRSMLSSGVLRIAGLVNPFRTKGMTVAMVGVSLQSHQQLDEKLKQISSLPKVHWAAVVTGRYDIIVEVVLSEEITDLYDFLDKDLSSVGGISSSESFVVMKAMRKWILIPEAMRQAFEK